MDFQKKKDLSWSIDRALSELIDARPGCDALRLWQQIKDSADELSRRAEEGIAEHSALPAYPDVSMSAAEYVADQERRAATKGCSSERYKRPPPCR